MVQPILDLWAGEKGAQMHTYPAGSWGPDAADEMLEKDGRSWRVQS